MKVKGEFVLLVCVIAFCFNGVCQGGSLRKRLYKKTCLRAEDIVRDMTWKHVSTNPKLPAKLLRLQFHDCFVRGCDASILINSTANNTAEKDTFPNAILSGFDVIEDIKAELMNQNKLFTEFAQSMKRIGAIGVLTGTKGEIRKKCSVVN